VPELFDLIRTEQEEQTPGAASGGSGIDDGGIGTALNPFCDRQ
jgi:hypothetical protein